MVAQRSPLEEGDDAETESGPAESGRDRIADDRAKAGDARDEEGEVGGHQQAQDKGHAEDDRHVARLDLLVAQTRGALPGLGEERAVPEAADREHRKRGGDDGEPVDCRHVKIPSKRNETMRPFAPMYWRNRKSAGQGD